MISRSRKENNVMEHSRRWNAEVGRDQVFIALYTLGKKKNRFRSKWSWDPLQSLKHTLSDLTFIENEESPIGKQEWNPLLEFRCETIIIWTKVFVMESKRSGNIQNICFCLKSVEFVDGLDKDRKRKVKIKNDAHISSPSSFIN